jgi:arginine-tRNA-protein transferase
MHPEDASSETSDELREDSSFGIVEPPRACSYLPEETASLEYRIVGPLTAARYAGLLRRGWRRHGRVVFRPRCPRCRLCRSLRVPVNEFRSSKSQRRTLKRNSGLDVQLCRTEVSDRHVELFNAYHADMSERRGWRPVSTTPEEYYASFLSGEYAFERELRYFAEGVLIGIGLVDIVPSGLSSIYFYHDPALRGSAVGVFSILTEIDVCRQLGIEFLYLGYWISRCPSMAYKADYRPHELLEEYVGDRDEPVWRRA